MAEGTSACGRVVDALRGASAVTLITHVRPDADTLGSALALAVALDRTGVDVEVGVPGSLPVPDVLTRLPGAKLIAPTSQIAGHRTAVALDCASAGRLDDLRDVFTGAETRIVIDHHASNTGFGDVDLIDPEADCTAELVLAVVDELGVDLDADIATCLYAGLVTDTGSFRWARPGSHAIAARLLATGVDGPSWTRALLDTHRFGWLAMVADALRSAVLVPEAFGGSGLVYACVDHTWREAIAWDEAESVIDLVRTVGDADVAVVFKESDPGTWTVSMRSRSATDLVPIARAHGGGGHPHAAGFGFTGPVEDVVASFLTA
ncbi:DHH family phosphoesterase [uncultured Williamsia sp.]|uniref:DHH family phosphoesterase n=1 Tax=uncultured Williamsia sp. TaxID=259311 RepID=UPI00262308BE|nr:DHH family phosphoesterase [uncultured Williamsia sp.]